MKRRPLIYLGIVIAIGVVVWLIERPELPKQGTVKETLLFEKMNPADINKIEIEHLINGLELELRDGSWEVAEFKTDLRKQLDKQDKEEAKKEEKEAEETNEEAKVFYKADQARIDKLLETLKNFKVETVISTNPEKQAQFQVNKIGLQIRAYDANGNKVAHLFIGKNGPDFMSTYVRRDGDDKVYLARQYLGPQFQPELKSWMHKSIWSKLGSQVKKAPPQSLRSSSP